MPSDLQQRDDVIACCIGVVGVSPGGDLAAVNALRNDRVTALISESSAVSIWFPQYPHRIPPPLIVHSRHDPIALLSDAMHLVDIAWGLNREAVMAIYDGTDHVLTGGVCKRGQCADR